MLRFKGKGCFQRCMAGLATNLRKRDYSKRVVAASNNTSSSHCKSILRNHAVVSGTGADLRWNFFPFRGLSSEVPRPALGSSDSALAEVMEHTLRSLGSCGRQIAASACSHSPTPSSVLRVLLARTAQCYCASIRSTLSRRDSTGQSPTSDKTFAWYYYSAIQFALGVPPQVVAETSAAMYRKVAEQGVLELARMLESRGQLDDLLRDIDRYGLYLHRLSTRHRARATESRHKHRSSFRRNGQSDHSGYQQGSKVEDEPQSYSVTAVDVCRIGTRLPLPENCIPWEAATDPTGSGGRSDRAMGDGLASYQRAQRHGATVLALEAALEARMEPSRTRREGRVAHWGLLLPAEDLAGGGSGEGCIAAQRYASLMLVGATGGWLGHLPAVVLGDEVATLCLAALDETVAELDSGQGEPGLSRATEDLNAIVVALGTAIGATGIAGGAGSYALVEALMDALSLSVTHDVRLPIETMALVATGLAGVSQTKPLEYVVAAFISSLKNSEHGSASDEEASDDAGSLTEKALVLASGGRALAELAVACSGDLSHGFAYDRLARDAASVPTSIMDMRPVQDTIEPFELAYNVPVWAMGDGSDDLVGPLAAIRAIYVGKETLRRASAVAERTQAAPCPGGPFSRELSLGIELVHSALGSKARLDVAFPWLAAPEDIPGQEYSARYRVKLHEHFLAYPIAWAANRSTTYCAGPSADCCGGCLPDVTADPRAQHNTPHRSSADGLGSEIAGIAPALWTPASREASATARAVSSALASNTWAVPPVYGSRLDALLWEGEDRETDWDGLLHGAQAAAYKQRLAACALPFPGPLIPGTAQQLQVGLDPKSRLPLDMDGPMPPPVRADIMWHGVYLGVLLCGSNRRAVAMLRLRCSKRASEELRNSITRGFACSSKGDTWAMSQLLTVDRLAMEQLEAGGVLSVRTRGQSGYQFGPGGLDLASYRRTVRSKALQGIAARRGIVLLLAKVQDQARGLLLAPDVMDALRGARHDVFRAAKSNVRKELRRGGEVSLGGLHQASRHRPRVELLHVPAATGAREAVAAIMAEPLVSMSVGKATAPLKVQLA